MLGAVLLVSLCSSECYPCVDFGCGDGVGSGSVTACNTAEVYGGMTLTDFLASGGS